MLQREAWLDLARKLDWDFTYVDEAEVYPAAVSGAPWLPHAAWAEWDEPYRTTFSEYVSNQHDKDAAVYAVRDAVGKIDDFARLEPEWREALKLHTATFPLAEYAAVVGNLGASRFGRDS